MPLYSFQPMFIGPIRAGIKGGTIRATRAKTQEHQPTRPGGHAHPGELLHLYCQVRSRNGFLIDRKRCVASEPIMLDFITESIRLGDRLILRVMDHELDRFARFDGFADFKDMAEFWRLTHPDCGGRFTGWHVRWLPLP